MAKTCFVVCHFFAVCFWVADDKELLCRQLADGKELADGKLVDSSSGSPASVEHHHRHHAVMLTKLSLNTRLDQSSRDVIKLNVC